jgi:serine/threonine protein kinase
MPVALQQSQPVDTDPVDGAPVSGYREGDLLPGDNLAWERLGVGHRCETWLAWSPAMWAPTVVKFPRPHQLDHPRARQTLGREVAALAGNPHPALPRLYVDGTAGAVPHLVFEFVDGSALDDEVDDRGRLAPLDAAILGWQLLAALRTVHARGLAHVDIKPANVMLRDARPILIDFGSARTLGAPQPSGKLIGSPGYAAPELEAGEPIHTSMDVFGIGVTLYEALADDWCFDPDLAAADRPAPRPLPDSPTGALVMRMLDPDPATRPDVDTTMATFGRITAAAGQSAWPEWIGDRLTPTSARAPR